MTMKPRIAAALSAAIVAGVTVFGFTFLPGLWVWASFIGWASYDQSGENPTALLTSSVCMVFGVVMAWLVALVVAGNLLPLPEAAASALAAGLASFVIVLVSGTKVLSNVPATFYGFASAFAFLLLTNGHFSVPAMTAPDLGNVLICVPVSLLIGSALGWLQQQFDGWLAR